MSAGSDRASAFMSIWSVAVAAVSISTRQPAAGLAQAGWLSNPGSICKQALLMKSSHRRLQQSRRVASSRFAPAPPVRHRRADVKIYLTSFAEESQRRGVRKSLFNRIKRVHAGRPVAAPPPPDALNLSQILDTCSPHAVSYPTDVCDRDSCVIDTKVE